MSRLILTRHAKSSWDDAALPDFDRPLNARGREAAPRMGRWLAGRGERPALALISGARRTRETWAGMAPHLPGTRLEEDRRLYGAGAAEILAVLAGREEASVLVIAHNPGMGELARWLTGDPPDHEGFARFPTAATLVLDLPGWDGLAAGAGRCTGFTVPRELD